MSKINRLTAKDKLFQQRLNKLADPPKSVYYIGQFYDYDSVAIAIVGTRKPTGYGQEVTRRLAYDLASQGVTIVSGLALGVDAIAHQAALDAGGRTIAVLAGGLDAIHPRSHTSLAKRILEAGGALMSEYPAGTPPRPYHFVARNRLIAAMADGTLITEAATKSGSLHTAQFALEQGCVVMAVPGEITNPMASGCLTLLKTGATLVSSSDDALFALGYKSQHAPTQLPLIADSKEEACLLGLIHNGVRSGEELLVASQLSAATFNQTLTMLEITGKIRALGANQWTLS